MALSTQIINPSLHFNGIYPSSHNNAHIFNESSFHTVNYQQQQNNKLLSSKLNNNNSAIHSSNVNFQQTKHNSPETLPYQSSTLSLAAFASDIEKEITGKILNQLQLKKDNPNNIIMVTLCQFMDEIIDNINKNMANIGAKFEESFNTFRKQQQQQQQLNQHNNNKQFNLLTNKLNTTNIKLENIIVKHHLQHQKSFNITSKKQQQQQQQLQINLDQELKKVLKINNIQNKKFDELQNQLNNIQLELKQSDKKQNNTLTNMMNKKNKIVQQRSPVKQIGIFEEKQLKTEDKLKLMTNKLLNKMQQQQKIYELSLEKLNKKLEDQTKKLIYNNRFEFRIIDVFDFLIILIYIP